MSLPHASKSPAASKARVQADVENQDYVDMEDEEWIHAVPWLEEESGWKLKSGSKSSMNWFGWFVGVVEWLQYFRRFVRRKLLDVYKNFKNHECKIKQLEEVIERRQRRKRRLTKWESIGKTEWLSRVAPKKSSAQMPKFPFGVTQKKKNLGIQDESPEPAEEWKKKRLLQGESPERAEETMKF